MNSAQRNGDYWFVVAIILTCVIFAVVMSRYVG